MLVASQRVKTSCNFLNSFRYTHEPIQIDMKTLVRIQEGEDTKNGFGFMTIQILVHPYKNSDSIDVVGHLSFQRTLGEEGPRRWYALNFNVRTDKVEHLEKMTRLARVIKKESLIWSQPEDVLKTIGAVEYVIFQHEFIPKSAEGENLYDAFFCGNLVTRVIAPNEKKALKKLVKRGYDKHEVRLNSKIIL